MKYDYISKILFIFIFEIIKILKTIIVNRIYLYIYIEIPKISKNKLVILSNKSRESTLVLALEKKKESNETHTIIMVGSIIIKPNTTTKTIFL